MTLQTVWKPVTIPYAAFTGLMWKLESSSAKNTESGLLWTLVSSSNTFKMNQICIFIDSVKNWKNDLLFFIAQCVGVS